MKFVSAAARTNFLKLSIPLVSRPIRNSRRIACDLSRHAKTEYTLNSLTYGWWLSDLWLSDPDQMVFRRLFRTENRAASHQPS